MTTGVVQLGLYAALSEADGQWLAGLTDGEGCFYFKLRSRGRPNCYSFDFAFKIALRADDAATINEVERILNVFACVTTRPRGGATKGHPLREFRVQRKSEIAKIIEFFRRYPLRSKKRRDFETWARAFEYYCEVIVAQPVKHVSFARIARPSAVQRRPLAGTPKAKLRRTPVELLDRMRVFEAELRHGRAYR